MSSANEAGGVPGAADQVSDPGEYNQRLRLKEIAEARQRARLALTHPERFGEGVEYDAVAYRVVQSLVTELEWMMRDQGGDEYFKQPLGSVTVTPPTKSEFEEKVGEVNEMPKNPEFEATEVQITGLFTTDETGVGFADVGGSVSDEWTTLVDPRHDEPQPVTVAKTEYIPVRVSRAANRLCRKFIHDVGLDARIENRPFAEY